MNRLRYRGLLVALLSSVSFVAFVSSVWATQEPGSPDEVTRLLSAYVALDTSNPPGDTTKAADFLTAILEKEGIPVTRYESAPGKVIVYARLKATVSPPAGKAILLLHHMDVVPADRAQWKTDPFTPTIQGGDLWGRGSMDMKGQGVAQLVAFLMLTRQNVPRTRDVILMAEPDEEVGGALGARWMIANHYAELDPEYVIDEGGFGSTDLFAPNKMVYGVSVAEKKIVWLKLRAEGVAGHGSQPTDTNPNDRLVRALARLLGDGGPKRPALQQTDVARPFPGRDPSVLDVMQAKIGAFAKNKFTNAIQQSTISLTWFRSGVGDPPKINVIPSVAEAGLDCRVLPGTTKDQWIAEVARRLGDPAIKIELINESDDPVVTSQDTPLYRNIEKVIQRRHPDAIVTPILIPYGTDSNAFRPKGVKSYGIFPALLPADVVGSMHGDGEHISLASVREGAQLFFEALRDTLSPSSPSSAPARAAAPIRVMLLDGESGGPYHAWKQTTQVLKRQLEEAGLFQVDVVTAPPAGASFGAFKPDFAKYQVIVLNYDAPDDRWPADLKASFEKYVSAGGGVVSVHASDNAFPGWKAFNDMIGVGGWRDRTETAGPFWFVKDGKLTSDAAPGKAGSHGQRLPFRVTVRNPNHPITRGLPGVWMHAGDELYASLRGPGRNMEVLATAHSDPSNSGTGRDEPQLLVLSYGKGRVFHTTMGHDVPALSSVDFVVTFQRGTEWAATGNVTQNVPANFPTADTVSVRADLAAMDGARLGSDKGQTLVRLVSDQGQTPIRPQQASPAAVPPPPTATPQSYQPEQVRAGQAAFSAQCGFCHGRDAMGGETGPDLTRAASVATDVRGNVVGPIVRNGRVDRGMPAFTLGDDDLASVVAFIHDQKTKAESLTGGRRAVDVADLQTGNAEAGKKYFTGACSSCHSPAGDFAGLAKRLEGLGLLQRMLYPAPAAGVVSRAKASIKRSSGETVSGTLAYRDEFTIAITETSGAYRAFPTNQVTFTVDDPLDAHVQLLRKYTDDDMHNVLAYLHTLR